MSTVARVLTDEMIEAIKAYIPRYPSKQAVTLPALHIVNDRLRYVPLQAIVEIAEILELAPAQVQDTLSFYGYFKQDKPHGEIRAWVCRSVSRNENALRSLASMAARVASNSSRGLRSPDRKASTRETASPAHGCGWL